MIAPIRGRDAELKAAGKHISTLIDGVGGVVVIEGPPGIGKTKLLTAFRMQADAAGVRPLFGESFEYQQAVPFAPLFMATLRAQPPIGDAEALRRVDHADSRYWVLHHLQEAVGAAASQAPLAIMLDDIHWADNSTLLALQSMTAGLADTRVLWVLSSRTCARPPAVDDTLRVLRDQGACFMRLGALSSEAVATIVQDAVSASADVSLLTLAARTRGNPFLLTELIHGLHEEDRIRVERGRATVTGDAMPQRLTVTMQQRLDLLSAEARHVVQVASVLPDRFSADLLATLLERRPVGLISALEEAVRADLLADDGDRLRFRHGLLRQATRESLPGPLRRAMERQAATVLLESGAAPGEVAAQLARSAEVGDKIAIDALRRAAQSAGSDPSTAADLSRRALELLPRDDPARGCVIAETVLLLNRATRYEEAQRLATTALSEALSADDEAQVRLGLSSSLTNPPGRRAQENRRALQLAPVNDVTRARHRGWLAFNLMMDGQSSEVREAANAAMAAAAETDDKACRLLAEIALANQDCAEGHTQRAVERLQSFDPLVHGGNLTVVEQAAAIHRTNLLITVGLLDDAAAAVAEGLHAASRYRNGMALQHFTQIKGLLHLAAGQLSAAREVIESLPAAARMRWTRIGCQLGMVTLARVAAHTGDRELLRQINIEARDACQSGGPAVRREGLAALAHLAWDRGDIEEAGRRLGPDFSLLLTPMWPVDLDHIALAARVADASADAELRARVLSAVDILDSDKPTAPLFNAIAQHARAILSHDVDALVDATSLLGSSPRPLLHAAAAEDTGRVLAQTDPCNAVEALNSAFEAFTACGATADAHRVGRELRKLGVSRRVARPRAKAGLDSLTDTELKVAHLVAVGSTNRAVAQHLYISPHTVNTHLRNVFAKLGINSRADLSHLINGPRELAS